MNSLSKVTLLVTLLTVPFAGFAMNFEADLTLPALEPDVVVEVAEQVTETAAQVAEQAVDNAPGYFAGAWNVFKNLGAKAFEKALENAPELSKENAGNAFGGLVIAGLGFGGLYLGYQVVKADRAAKAALKAGDSQDSKKDQENPQADNKSSSIVQNVLKYFATKDTEVVETTRTQAPKAPVAGDASKVAKLTVTQQGYLAKWAKLPEATFNKPAYAGKFGVTKADYEAFVKSQAK